MIKTGVWGASVLLVVLFSGCQTTGSWEQAQRQEARRTAEFQSLQASMQRLEHRVVDLAREQEVLGHDLLSLRNEVGQRSVQVDAGLVGLSSRLDEQARSQVAMRKELTDDLSKRMATILEAQNRAAATAAAARRPVATGARTETGYEHEVQAGETLSEIARAYGVTTKDIIRANQLRDADILRVGQKLFIPERSR